MSAQWCSDARNFCREIIFYIQNLKVDRVATIATSHDQAPLTW